MCPINIDGGEIENGSGRCKIGFFFSCRRDIDFQRFGIAGAVAPDAECKVQILIRDVDFGSDEPTVSSAIVEVGHTTGNFVVLSVLESDPGFTPRGVVLVVSAGVGDGGPRGGQVADVAGTLGHAFEIFTEMDVSDIGGGNEFDKDVGTCRGVGCSNASIADEDVEQVGFANDSVGSIEGEFDALVVGTGWEVEGVGVVVGGRHGTVAGTDDGHVARFGVDAGSDDGHVVRGVVVDGDAANNIVVDGFHLIDHGVKVVVGVAVVGEAKRLGLQCDASTKC